MINFKIFNLLTEEKENLKVSITVLSSNVKILASNTDIFSDTNIEIKSKKSEGRSLVISVNSKKFLFIFFIYEKIKSFCNICIK